MEIDVRRADAADIEFLRRVHREAMGPHIVAAWGEWDEEAQRERFYGNSDPTTHEIIVCDGEDVGCQWVRTHADAFELVRLYVLPEAQGRGIGTQLVTRLCRRAARDGLPVRLRVLKVNPARHLYQRLGFEIVGENDSHFSMRREA